MNTLYARALRNVADRIERNREFICVRAERERWTAAELRKIMDVTAMELHALEAAIDALDER